MDRCRVSMRTAAAAAIKLSMTIKGSSNGSSHQLTSQLNFRSPKCYSIKNDSNESERTLQRTENELYRYRMKSVHQVDERNQQQRPEGKRRNETRTNINYQGNKTK